MRPCDPSSPGLLDQTNSNNLHIRKSSDFKHCGKKEETHRSRLCQGSRLPHSFVHQGWKPLVPGPSPSALFRARRLDTAATTQPTDSGSKCGKAANLLTPQAATGDSFQRSRCSPVCLICLPCDPPPPGSMDWIISMIYEAHRQQINTHSSSSTSLRRQSCSHFSACCLICLHFDPPLP